jgi:hypothetical protein
MATASIQSVPLAELVLAVHLAIIAFNIFGLIAIPLGAWRRWDFVRGPLWRLLHVASLGVVALQAAVGDVCFLTTWQGALTGAQNTRPVIMQWVNAIIFWPLPGWLFNALYVLVFAYVLALLWLVPPRSWKSRRPWNA